MKKSDIRRVIRQYSKAAKGFAAVAYVEKGIIAPHIQKAFKKAARATSFDNATDRAVDIGCGPFLLGLPLLLNGIHVDGTDVTPGMLIRARTKIGKADLPRSFNRDKIRLVQSSDKLPQGGYKFAMMNFVHQCCADRESLLSLFNSAARLLKEDAHLVLTTTHQDFLHIPHSTYSCNVTNSSKLSDGEQFGGTIYDPIEDRKLDLGGDHFWKHSTLLKVAEEAGFELVSSEDIADQDTPSRKASPDPAYRMITWRKKKEDAPVAVPSAA